MALRNTSHQLSISNICRGHGNIYALLSVRGTGVERLDIRSVVRGSEEVPARIISLEGGECVIELAVLKATQTVTVTAYDDNGQELAQIVRNIGRRFARLSSQAHTLAKSPVIARIRNCDSVVRPGDIEFVETRLVMGAPGESDFLHITTCLPCIEESGTSVSLVAFHPDGTRYPDSAVCVVGDTVLPHQRVSDALCRYVCFSVALPKDADRVSVWATTDGPEACVGLLSIEPFTIAGLRGDWIGRTLGNESCPGYEDWFLGRRTSEAELQIQRHTQLTFKVRPLFSVIVPLYHTPIDFFSDMADSVLNQTYDNLELVLVNSTPEDTELADAVSSLATKDPRVRVVTLEGNLGITENTNAGINVARGDFISFFDHDDILEPDLLFWYVREINAHPDVDMLYCDEDKFENGHYSYPFFKPDWSPVFLETNNYVCHLLTVRSTLLRSLPVATSEFDGAQDHRLALLAGSEARRVAHVNRMLYHWRVHEQSTAANAEAKPESLEAGRKAIELSLEWRGIAAHAENIEGMPHCYRIVYDKVGTASTSIVILHEGTDEQLDACVAAVRSLVDDLDVEIVTTQPLEHAGRLAQTINEAVSRAKGSMIVLLSSLVIPTDATWLHRLLAYAMRPDVGIAGGRVDFADGTKARGSVVVTAVGWRYANRLLTRDSAGSRGLERLAHESAAVSGTCLMLGHDTFDAVGGISDGADGYSWFVDLSLKVRQHGLSVVECPGGIGVMGKDVFDLGLETVDDIERSIVADAWLRESWPLTFGARDPYYARTLGLDGYYDLIQENGSPAEPLGESAVDRRDDAGVYVHVTSMIRDGDFDIVRGETILTDPKRERLQESIEQLCIANDSEPLASSWTCMGDSVEELRDIGGFRRTVSFSARIPASVPAFSVGVTIGGDTYVCDMGEKQVGTLREAWRDATLPIDQDPKYDEWFRTEHRITPSELNIQRHLSEHPSPETTFSIIVPLYQTPIDFLNEMVQSVLAQSYPHFELILVNASPEIPKLCQTVLDYCRSDRRIREVRLDENLGITENTNFGIRAATGTFLAFLDHDDVIEPDLLYWYAKAVHDHPTTDLLYCDEDHLADGNYVLPFIKSDWDLDRLRTENYICHMLAVRRSVVDALDSLPSSEMDGSQDHNMALMVGERARNVFHVRRVLYHWRAHENSTAGDEGTQQKSYALEAERIAVQNHLDRTESGATAEMGTRRATRVDVVHSFDLQPLVSIVIPNKDMADVLGRCVESIRSQTTWKNYEIVIVENGSTEPETFAYYQKIEADDRRVRVVTHVPKDGFNFSKLINTGFDQARGDYLLMLNNDIEVLTADWIEQLMGICQRDNVGGVGAKLLYPDDTIQHVGVFVGNRLGPTHTNMHLPASDEGYYEVNELPHRVSAATGACLLTKRAAWEQVGGLDEKLPVDYNDIDFCLRLQKAGLAVVVQTNAVLRHYESVTRGHATDEAAIERFTRSRGRFNGTWPRTVAEPDAFGSPTFGWNGAYYRLDPKA